MVGTGVLQGLIQKKRDDLDFLQYQIRNVGSAGEERADMLERMNRRIQRVEAELAELKSNLELVEKYNEI